MKKRERCIYIEGGVQIGDVNGLGEGKGFREWRRGESVKGNIKEIKERGRNSS